MMLLHLSRAGTIALMISTLPAARVYAQGAERVGDFAVEVRTNPTTGQDSSFATLWPTGGYFSPDVETGILFVACGRDRTALASAVMLPATGATGDTVLVALRFGQEKPDTLVLEAGEEVSTFWYFRNQDVASVFRRGHEVDSLTLQMLSAPAPGQRTRVTYALSGVDTVLSRLGCAVVPPGPGRLAGRKILRSLRMVDTAAVDPPGPTNLMGDFFVEVLTDSTTGQDSSFATLWPEGRSPSREPRTGVLLLACGRDSAALAGAVMLPAGGAMGDTLLVALRFGQEEPDTLVLEAAEEVSTSWYFREQDVASVFRRAHEVDSLTLQMLSASETGRRTRFTYALAGLDTVLSRLGCAVIPPSPGRLAGRKILNRFQIVERSAVEQPRPTNLADLRRYMERHTPREFRRAGVQGEVSLRVRVGENGRVDSASIQVLRSTNEALSAVAIGAVRQLLFRPATAYGRPVKVWIEMPFAF